MSTAVALFVDYPLVPEAIRNRGRQPGFQFGHCMLIRNLGTVAPGWLDEFTSEPGPITDCVPATGVRGINFQTHGRMAPTTPAEREALQNAMGTQDQGADERQLAGGIAKRYGISAPYGQDWAAIVKAIGSETSQVIVGDPLASSDYASVALGNLKPASAGLGYRYVLFPEQPVLPDTSTEVDSVTIVKDVEFYGSRSLSFAAGKYTGYHLDGTTKPYTLTSSSSAHVRAKVVISQDPQKAPNGTFYEVIDGVWAGYYIPIVTVGITLASAPAEFTQADLDRAKKDAATAVSVAAQAAAAKY